MDEDVQEGSSLTSEKPRFSYQAPQVVLLEKADPEGGATNVPENSTGMIF